MQRALPTRDTELATLRRTAEDLAKQRGQKPTTTHLLAALAGGRDDAAQLLLDRRLDAEVLLKAARVTVDDTSDAIARAIQRARELAGRSGAGRTEARSVHVLFSLCQESGTAAHRALVQCGTDVTRLRTSAMQLAMGLAPPRRMTHSAEAVARTSGIMPVGRVVTTPGPATVPGVKRDGTPVGKVGSPSPKVAFPRSGTSTVETGKDEVGTKVGSHAKGKRKEPVPVPIKETAKATKARVDRFALDPKQFPLLCQLGQNLTQLAARGELDPVVGRDAEIERALDVLAKRNANNACLIGAPGVGKTSVVRGLAVRIANGDDVACFEDKILVGSSPRACSRGSECVDRWRSGSVSSRRSSRAPRGA